MGCYNNGCIPKTECDRCKPKCDPCSKQQRIMYCGKALPCVGVKKGDDLNKVIELFGDELCGLKQLISTQGVRIIENPDCGELGGFVIEIYDIPSDEVISSASYCVPETEVDFYENGDFVASSNSVGFSSGSGVTVTSNVDEEGNVTYTFDSDSVNCIDITYDEGLNLIKFNEVICNALYHVTDRGYYLQGLNSDTFSSRGHRIQKIIKNMYYDTANTKGVYNKYVTASASTGEIFIYGAKVWEAQTTVPIITPSGVFDLGSGFLELTDNIYFVDRLFKIDYDYPNDIVLSQTDMRNNTIVYKKTSGIDYVTNADWGFLDNAKRMNNNFNMFINNHINNNSNVNNNNINNFAQNKIMGDCNDNIIKTDFTGNCLDSINGNTAMWVVDNIGHQESLLSTISYNTSIFINGNVVDLISYNKGNITNNLDIATIYNNVIDTISGNESVNIESNYCPIIQGNTSTPIIEPITGEETLSYISYNVVNDMIRDNSLHINGISNNKCLSIINNINVEVSRNVVKDILNNYNCLIKNNTNNGDISDNNNISQQALYEIIFNNNNGGIYNNQPTTTGLQIHNNNNNGRIGQAGVPTSRSGYITDIMVNK